MMSTRLYILRPAAWVLVIAQAVCLTVSETAAREPRQLQVLSGGYPRAFFFRSSEGAAANPRVPYQRWEASFGRLMGIQGKVLDEEVPGRSQRNIEFFSDFKRRFPRQLVLLHYNGNARDPRYQTQGKYFAGHWIYYNGATILSDVPAEAGETEIHVSDASLFHTGVGRYRDRNEDIGLCALDERRRPNWFVSEQVHLVSADPQRGTILVRRGCYGTTPREFTAGKAYAAAHVHEGPWGRKSHLMWFYNYSTVCPQDAAGRSCADIHVRELAARFASDGELAAFDGVEFDVLQHRCGRGQPGRAPDCDADGRPDAGVFDGVNRYGAGVIQFCGQLRDALGEDTLILADGHGPYHQRAFGLLNGIESEGWPALNDWQLRDWSGGLNRHRFWRANGRAPVFNYVNHKFTEAGELPGQRVLPDVPWGVHRLVFAAAVFTDSAICYSFPPPREPGELIGIWDELVEGIQRRPGWLGQPRGPAVCIARESADLLAGDRPGGALNLRGRLAGKGFQFVADQGAVKIAPNDESLDEIAFQLRGVPCHGPDLFVTVTARGERLPEYPAQMARLAWVGIASPEGKLITAELPATAMCRRGGSETPIEDAAGASVRWSPRARLGDRALPAYLVHPPYRDGTGYTCWFRDVTVPQQGRLEFVTGMGDKAPERSDGVVFRVEAGELEGGSVAEFQQLFEHTQVASRWVSHQVSLAKWTGKRVRLKFISDCGPNDNATTDHSMWGDAVVVGPEGRDGLTSPVRHMTWLNETEFESTFYFSDVRSPQVDIEFVVEGKQPVWIQSITAHAHPDVVYREFDRGLVIANPAPRPYEMNLAARFPEQGFRRLQGSAAQDPACNNGQAVSGTLRLGPQEGIFLVRE